jgi:hypothetical protein
MSKVKPVRAWALIVDGKISHTATEYACPGQYCRRVVKVSPLLYIKPEKPAGIVALMPFQEVEIRPIKQKRKRGKPNAR